MKEAKNVTYKDLVLVYGLAKYCNRNDSLLFQDTEVNSRFRALILYHGIVAMPILGLLCSGLENIFN